MQIRTERAVLPADHPKRTSVLLDRAIAAVEGAESVEVAQTVLREMMEDEDRAFYEVRLPT